mgnify:CR=1 FL=1
MDAIFDKLWGIFVGLGWWMLNRLTAKIDALESNKAESNVVKDLDKRVDALSYENVGRKEYKADIGLLHSRINNKQDIIKTIRLAKDK